MKHLFYGLIILSICAVVGLFALDNLTRSSAELAYQQAAGRALIIEAQGQSRLDSAQALAVVSGATLPWLIVLCVSGAVLVSVAIILRSPIGAPAQPAQIVERQIIFLPADYSRRELMRAVDNFTFDKRNKL